MISIQRNFQSSIIAIHLRDDSSWHGPARAYWRLLALESNSPQIGWCYSNHRGEFYLRFDKSDYKDSAPPNLEGEPELKLQIFDIDGAEVGFVGLSITRCLKTMC